MSGILTVQSGRPFTPRLSVDNSNTGNVGGFFAHDRPNVVGDPHLEDPTPEHFFNTDAFQIPQSYTFGNAGRNVLLGPGLNNVDIALLKNISVRPTQMLQFRAEFFNALNHPYFHYPTVNVQSGSFGKISSTSGDNRIIQFALKYNF